MLFHSVQHREEKKSIGMDQKKERTILIGIGNPILCDDGVGIYAARSIKERLQESNHWKVDVAETSAAGLELIDLVEGYGKAILIDSTKTERFPSGQIYKLNVDELNDNTDPLNIHLMGIRGALDFGKKIGKEMPHSISIYAIEVQDNTTFGERLSPEVQKRLPDLVIQVLQEITSSHF